MAAAAPSQRGGKAAAKIPGAIFTLPSAQAGAIVRRPIPWQDLFRNGMSGRRTHAAWWQGLSRSERLNGAERLLLGVSGLALSGILVMLIRVLG